MRSNMSHRAAKYILPLALLAIILFTPGSSSADVYAEYESPSYWRSCYHSNTNVESRRTDHFLIRFGNVRKQGLLTEQLFQGQLQFLEHVYDTWRTLGLHDLGGYDATNKYKGIVEPGVSFLGDAEGTAVGFSEPPSSLPCVPGIHAPAGTLDYRNPNGCTPHEFGHGWQNYFNGGLPASQPQGFTESLANWMMQQQLVGYPQDWITVGMPMTHAAVGYNCMSLFNYFMYAPGYGSNFINALVCSTNVGASLPDPDRYYADDIVRKAIRVDTSGAADKGKAIRDGLGLMNAKMLDMDFWNHRMNNVVPYQQDTNWAYQLNGIWGGYQFHRIPMVRQPGVDAVWYRPEWTCIPQTLMNCYIPLTITVTGSSRTITCDFRPVADGIRGSSFRACFVAFNANKEPHYSSVWNAGEKSFVLADDEQTVYLAVIANPRVHNVWLGHNDYTLDNVAMFPYRIKLDGAVPKDWRWPVPTSGVTRHPNGGGIKATSATVDSSAFIGTNAMVLGTAKVYGNARIEDFARVDGNAIIGRSGQPDTPVVSGHAYVTENSQVYGRAKIRDYAWVWGTSRVYENGIVMAHTMLGGGAVYGCAVLNNGPLRDQGLCENGMFSGSAIVGGDISALGVTACDKGVWCEYPAISVADNAYQYLGYNFEKTNCVFAMDQYGMNHSYLMNFPQVVGDTVNGTATKVLTLHPVSNQYVEVRPDAVDFADLTISVWVKWLGSADNQAVFSFGDGSNKVMCLTAKDATTGFPQFRISTGAVTQYLDSAAPLASNVWTHFAVTLDGSTGTFYVGGPQVNQNTSMTIDPDQLHAPLMENANYLGRDNTGNYFFGRIDEFRVYNKALTSGEVAAVKANVKAGTWAGDTTAPTPATPTWLVNPVATGADGITMSATEGSDPNGVFYYFRCTNAPSHDSGWLSENTYTDWKAEPGMTYTYGVRMKDARGNTTAESVLRTVAADAADTTPPSPDPPSFSFGPLGSSTTSITMTATAGTDMSETVLYRFIRIGSAVNSGWTSSRTWTDRGLTPGASYSYSLQMKDGHGNSGTVFTSSSTVARDDTPPSFDTDPRMQWDLYPYAQVNKAVRMYARPQVEMTGIQFYYECVEQTNINSGWRANTYNTGKTPDWITPPLTNGTYHFRIRLRDLSPQTNMTAWSEIKAATVSDFNGYTPCALDQLASMPDSMLVMFTGIVVHVTPLCYVVSNGTATINVTSRAYLSKTEASLLGQRVNVKGHLWTYTGTPKRVTYAHVFGNPQSGKIEFENCDNNELPRLLFDTTASGSECLGWYQEGWQGEPWWVLVTNIAAASEITIAYKGGGGNLSLYTNGVHALNVNFPNNATWNTKTQTGLNIAAGTSLKFQHDAGDTEPTLDYMIVGGVYTISGKVTNTLGDAITNATVSFAETAGAAMNPYYTTTTDATGGYAKTVTPETWYVAAGAPLQRYLTSSERAVIVSNANVGNVTFALAPLAKTFIRTNDLLLACVVDMLPDSGVINRWQAFHPSDLALEANGSPSVEMIAGRKWEKNSVASYDRFAWRNVSWPIAVSGVTVIASARPVRDGIAEPWQAIADIFMGKVSLGIMSADGVVHVSREKDVVRSTGVLPDGKPVVLSLVIQPDGRYKVYTNGVQFMSVTTTSAMTNLVPTYWEGTTLKPGWPHIAIGGNEPDAWSAHNGNIGDVAIYKVALSDAERQLMEKTFAGESTTPFVDITNDHATVTADTTSLVIRGTNNSAVVGGMWVANAALGGALTSFPATVSWTTPAVRLAFGTNSIRVFGTNMVGLIAGDTVSIVRATGPTPVITITNPAPINVAYGVTSCIIGGTNANIATPMWWSNSLAPGVTAISFSGADFSANIAGLVPGANVIRVFGTNIYGAGTSAVVTINRAFNNYPQIATNALLFPSPGAVLYAPMPTSIIWNVEGISDVEDGTNIMIGSITVNYANATTQQVDLVTNAIPNTAGQCLWNVPAALAVGTTYVIRFEVFDSASLSNSRVFSNSFAVVPESGAAMLVLLAMAHAMRRRRM